MIDKPGPITVAVMRCSRCNNRLVGVDFAKCDNCGAAFRRVGDRWLGDLDRWETKDGWKKKRND